MIRNSQHADLMRRGNSRLFILTPPGLIERFFEKNYFFFRNNYSRTIHRARKYVFTMLHWNIDYTVGCGMLTSTLLWRCLVKLLLP